MSAKKRLEALEHTYPTTDEQRAITAHIAEQTGNSLPDDKAQAPTPVGCRGLLIS